MTEKEMKVLIKSQQGEIDAVLIPSVQSVKADEKRHGDTVLALLN